MQQNQQLKRGNISGNTGAARKEMFPRCWTRDSPAACGANHHQAAVSLQPLEVHGGAEICLLPMDNPTLDQVYAPKRL